MKKEWKVIFYIINLIERSSSFFFSFYWMNRKRQLSVSQRSVCAGWFTTFGRCSMRTSCPGFMFCPAHLLLSKECINVELINDTCCCFLLDLDLGRVCDMWFIDLNWYHLWYHFLIMCSYNQQRIQSSTCTSVLTSPLSIQVRNYSHTHTHTELFTHTYISNISYSHVPCPEGMKHIHSL